MGEITDKQIFIRYTIYSILVYCAWYYGVGADQEFSIFCAGITAIALFVLAFRLRYEDKLLDENKQVVTNAMEMGASLFVFAGLFIIIVGIPAVWLLGTIFHTTSLEHVYDKVEPSFWEEFWVLLVPITICCFLSSECFAHLSGGIRKLSQVPLLLTPFMILIPITFIFLGIKFWCLKLMETSGESMLSCIKFVLSLTVLPIAVIYVLILVLEKCGPLFEKITDWAND